jgi:pimeloyl-ACP methyl ester carboxylesterase
MAVCSQEAGQLEAMLWQSVMASHSASFLRAHEAKFPSWVEAAARANTAAGLLAILSQTHHDDPADPFHTAQLAARVGRGWRRLEEEGSRTKMRKRRRGRVLVVGGTEDRLAPAAEVRRLAEALRAGGAAVDDAVIMEGAGHMMAIEQPAAWRAAVLRFLNYDELGNDEDDDSATAR